MPAPDVIRGRRNKKGDPKVAFFSSGLILPDSAKRCAKCAPGCDQFA